MGYIVRARNIHVGLRTDITCYAERSSTLSGGGGASRIEWHERTLKQFTKYTSIPGVLPCAFSDIKSIMKFFVNIFLNTVQPVWESERLVLLYDLKVIHHEITIHTFLGSGIVTCLLTSLSSMCVLRVSLQLPESVIAEFRTCRTSNYEPPSGDLSRTCPSKLISSIVGLASLRLVLHGCTNIAICHVLMCKLLHSDVWGLSNVSITICQ
jgi:hypothetical protein